MSYLYTTAELMDIVLIYGEAHQNLNAAATLYAKKFPKRHVPDHETFLAVVTSCRENGTLHINSRQDRSMSRTKRINYAEEEILSVEEENLDFELDNFKNHIQHVHALQLSDYPLRVRFCEWLLGHNAQNSQFSANVLATDLAIFKSNKIHNIDETHIWKLENPQTEMSDKSGPSFSLNVWAGIVDDHLIGPFYLPDQIDDLKYLEFLRHNLSGLLENVPLTVRLGMWFIDNRSVYSRLVLQENGNKVNGAQWIRQRNLVVLPPSSHDLNPLDFFLWKYLKTEVYKTKVQTIEELRERIAAATEKLRLQEGKTLKLMRKNWIRRAQLCMRVRGQNFQHLL